MSFRDCVSLTNIALPDSVTSIGERAFSESPDLKITASRGSYAQKYCEENGIPYKVE